MKKILIVEDEESIRGFLKINLKRNGFEVLETDNGEEGLEIVEREEPDIVILDVMLPGIDGFEVCKRVREKQESIGIIMLTAKGQEMDKIIGLEYGADDYMVKPFNPMELLLRIKAILRRIGKDDEKKVLKEGIFTVDIYGKKIFKGDEEIDLTPKEYSLIKIFIENPNRAFSRDELLDLAWGKNYFADSKIIDVNIRRLRSKIEDSSSKQGYIETIWGFGYRWRGEECEEYTK
ncbi:MULTISPECIES: response regulator transcription factor [unclassified Clostridium]|uniref:response regulator transcription factor n=1 Tax=Clostridium TaxID=1485 RepID=UPI001C8C173C|nr:MULTISPECIES: response regulator transcription factor [unclassified Clostridium]MBX9137891.1 response regulator transcription factor [Clostridium sp. K12(2020)]MBX9143452.1 response regulator transcription factor [Clostridium sp. K13]MDU2288505.1 response regulator transcription factor [Clostridium celatum]MDU4325741.1 response regulator transcription factor [Clostridium celatum]